MCSYTSSYFRNLGANAGNELSKLYPLICFVWWSSIEWCEAVWALPFILAVDTIAENVGVITSYPLYPNDEFSVGVIGCNLIIAITSPFLHRFGRDLNQNDGGNEIYLLIYNLGGYDECELWYSRILIWPVWLPIRKYATLTRVKIRVETSERRGYRLQPVELYHLVTFVQVSQVGLDNFELWRIDGLHVE